MENKKNKKKSSLFPVIIVAVLAGLFSGIAGEIIFKSFYPANFNYSYLNSDFNLSNLNYNRPSLVIRDAKKIVVSQDVKVAETISSVQPALLRIYKKLDDTTFATRASTSSPSLNLDLAKDEVSYYKLDEPDFIALNITSDGWVIAALPSSLVDDFKAEDYVAIDNNRKLYNLDEVAEFKELPASLVFLHLEDASNLAIRAVAPRSDIYLGQTALLLSDFDKINLSSISGLEFSGGILSSDELNVRLSLASSADENTDSSFVFNLAGDLLAISSSNRELVPAFSYIHYWQSFFVDKDFGPPYLGVNYLDLSRNYVVGVDKDKGALLKSSETEKAVAPSSPAALAGLKSGDIITWVNNKELSVNNDLSSIISSYSPGDEIALTYIRDGKESSVKFILGLKK